MHLAARHPRTMSPSVSSKLAEAMDSFLRPKPTHLASLDRVLTRIEPVAGCKTLVFMSTYKHDRPFDLRLHAVSAGFKALRRLVLPTLFRPRRTKPFAHDWHRHASIKATTHEAARPDSWRVDSNLVVVPLHIGVSSTHVALT